MEDSLPRDVGQHPRSARKTLPAFVLPRSLLGERANPDLLAAVRGVFAQDVLTGGFRPEAIKAGRTADSFAGRAGILRGWRVIAARDGQPLTLRPNALEASEAQARHVAVLVAASIATGRRPEQHAVLLRTRSRMRLYAQALERAGIPYDTDFPGGLYDAQECHDVEAVLRLCINPHDRRALAIALGGPWGAPDASDRTLMVQALERAPADGWAHAAANADIGALVAGLRPVLAAEGVAAAIRRLIADERLARRYAALPLARRRIANLARLAEEEQAAGIALDAPAFIARLAERRRLGVDSEEVGGEHLGSRGVRLMTIHQAKGLEWPVVILPDQHKPFDRRDLTAKALAQVGDHGLEVACHPGDEDPDDTIGLKAGLVADHLRGRQQAEEARLFYVACTRAAEELHALIPAVAPAGPLRDGSVRCPADWLVGANLTWDDVTIDLDAAPVRQPSAAISGELFRRLFCLARLRDLLRRHHRCGIAPGVADIGRNVGDLLVGHLYGIGRHRSFVRRARRRHGLRAIEDDADRARSIGRLQVGVAGQRRVDPRRAGAVGLMAGDAGGFVEFLAVRHRRRRRRAHRGLRRAIRQILQIHGDGADIGVAHF